MLDSFFGAFSEAVSFPEDQLRCLSALFLSYPLALGFKHLPNHSNVRHLASVLTSFFLIVVIVDDVVGLTHLLGSSIAVWRIMGAVKGKWGPRIVFVGVMLHMSVSHLYRQFHDYRGYKLDHTGPQMILTMKLTSWAFNVYDGRRNQKELSRYQQEHAVAKFPPLLHYLSYIFFFPAVLVGPTYEYMDYIRFIDLTQFRDKNNSSNINWPAGRVRTAMQTLLFALVALACLAFAGPKMDALWCMEEGWRQLPFVHRFIYAQFAALAARFKYYAVWKLAEGACILAGFGFNGINPVTGLSTWDQASNINVWAYETGQSVKALADNWNMGTNKWLKHSVYFRVVAPGTKPGFLETFATFGVSAFWHGFYPGYYLMFSSAAIALTAGKKLRSSLRPKFVDPKTGKTPLWYNMAGMVLTQITINYLSLSFLILTLADSLQVWRDMYFAVHIGLVLILILVPILLPVKRAPRSAATDASKSSSSLEVLDPLTLTAKTTKVL